MRKRHSDSGADEAAIDLTPMLDIVFIMLIFFIVTTTFVEETGVEVDKPQAASAVRLEKTSILIALTAKAMRDGLEFRPPLRSLSVQFLAGARFGELADALEGARPITIARLHGGQDAGDKLRGARVERLGVQPRPADRALDRLTRNGACVRSVGRR